MQRPENGFVRLILTLPRFVDLVWIARDHDDFRLLSVSKVVVFCYLASIPYIVRGGVS